MLQFRRASFAISKTDREDSQRVGKNLTKAEKRTIINISTRDGAVWKLVGLITRRSQVQILLPQFFMETGSVTGTGFSLSLRLGAGRDIIAAKR